MSDLVRSVGLEKSQRIIITCFFGSILLLGFVIIYGLHGIAATAFLIEKHQISYAELLATIRWWFWSIVFSLANYLVIFAAWYFSNRQLLRMIKRSGELR